MCVCACAKPETSRNRKEYHNTLTNLQGAPVLGMMRYGALNTLDGSTCHRERGLHVMKCAETTCKWKNTDKQSSQQHYLFTSWFAISYNYNELNWYDNRVVKMSAIQVPITFVIAIHV